MLGRLPPQVAWRHAGAREGFEVTFVAEDNDVLCFMGTTVRVRMGTPGPSVINFTCVLAYDHAGLLLDYPGIAVRAA